MTFSIKYNNGKEKLLNDKAICKENRDLFKKFFEWEENKLKRTNNLPQLDEACYNTLCGYLLKLSNVNKWFNNKPWKKLTKEDIKRVYNDLEDGKIKNNKGARYGDLKSYYGKVFRSKPFDMAGKTHIVKEVMEFYRRSDNQEVRFIEEATFRKIVQVVIRPEQKLLCWLAWDIGENVNSLLQLKKSDFLRQLNPNTREVEYRVNLPKDKLKRTRMTRSEFTNYKETAELLDFILKDLNDDDVIYNFKYAQAKKFLNRAVHITNAKCIPKGQNVTFKDLRSSMACHLLKNHWTLDEVNARLGHKPSSKEIDKYVNFLAMDRHETKKKIYNNSLEKVENELEETKQNLKLTGERMKKQSDDIIGIKLNNLDLKNQLVELATNYKKSLIEMKELILKQKELNEI
ncbi:MAG: hypothetical protein WC781_03425 [Candidatus Pacearchaeota archaeon]|jgi:integrase